MPQALTSARLALALLQSHAMGVHAARVENYVLVPTSAPINVEDATRWLANRPKPLMCSSRREGASLVVICRATADSVSPLATWLSDSLFDRLGDRLIHVRGGGLEGDVTLDQLQELFGDYWFPFEYRMDIAGGRTALERRNGVYHVFFGSAPF